MRLPALIGFVLYLVFSFKVSRQIFSSRKMALLAFAALNSNILLIELFSLARGYSLSLGLMLVGIYYYVTYLRSNSRKDFLIVLTTLFLSTMANFAVFNLFAALVVTHFGWKFSEALRKGGSSAILATARENIVEISAAGLFMTPLAVFLLRLVRTGEAYFGGSQNFLADTYQDMVGFWLRPDTLVLLAVAVIVAYTYSRITKLLMVEKVILAIAGVLFLIVNMQYYILHSPLPIERTASYMFPLLALVVMIGISKINLDRRLLILFTAVLMVNAVAKVDFSKSILWWFNADDKAIAQKVIELDGNGINAHWFNYRSINYYLLGVVPVQEVLDPEGINPELDYLYLPATEQYPGLGRDWVVVERFPDSGSILYARVD
jgi:hypothetical protein